MNSRKVNIHFESEISNQKINNKVQFDFIYFLLNSDDIPLNTKIKFESEYLNFLESLGFNPQFVDSSDHIENWWVPDPSSEMTKKYNSKVFIHKFLQENKITVPNGVVVHHINEFERNRDEYNLLRLEYSVSGRGTFLIQEAPKNLRYPLILAKKRERVLDFGLFGNANKYDQYLTLVDDRFCFRGFLISNNELKHNREVSALLDLARQKFISLSHLIQEIDSVESIQVDSFLYSDNGKLELEFCHEVNFRKSMSLLINAVNNKNLVKKNWSAILLLPSSTELPFGELLKKWEIEIGLNEIIPLSPITKGLSLFLVNFDEVNRFDEITDLLARVLGNRNNSVYNEISKLIKRLVTIHESR